MMLLALLAHALALSASLALGMEDTDTAFHGAVHNVAVKAPHDMLP